MNKLERNKKYPNEGARDVGQQKKYNSNCLIGNWSGEKFKQDVSWEIIILKSLPTELDFHG